MSTKEAKASIICLKYSYRGDFLAVSFNNEYREDLGARKVEEIGSHEPSFVLLYANRLSLKNPGR